MGDMLFEVQILYKERLRFMQIDRAGMHHPQGTLAVDGANGPRSIVDRRLQDNTLRGGGTQGDGRRGILVGHPEILVMRLMGFIVGDHELQIFVDDLGGEQAKALALLEGQLEHGAAQVLEQDEQVIRVDQRLLGRALEEILRMVGEELVERTGGGDHDRCSGFEAASRPPRLLPRRSDGARVADEDRRAQPADIDAQLEGVRSNHGPDGAFSQSLFDLAALVGKIAGAVAANGIGGFRFLIADLRLQVSL